MLGFFGIVGGYFGLLENLLGLRKSTICLTLTYLKVSKAGYNYIAGFIVGESPNRPSVIQSQQKICLLPQQLIDSSFWNARYRTASKDFWNRTNFLPWFWSSTSSFLTILPISTWSLWMKMSMITLKPTKVTSSGFVKVSKAYSSVYWNQRFKQG